MRSRVWATDICLKGRRLGRAGQGCRTSSSCLWSPREGGKHLAVSVSTGSCLLPSPLQPAVLSALQLRVAAPAWRAPQVGTAPRAADEDARVEGPELSRVPCPASWASEDGAGCDAPGSCELERYCSDLQFFVTCFRISGPDPGSRKRCGGGGVERHLSCIHLSRPPEKQERRSEGRVHGASRGGSWPRG